MSRSGGRRSWEGLQDAILEDIRLHVSVSVFVSVSLCASRMGFWSICPSFHTYICMCANERERERERFIRNDIRGESRYPCHVWYVCARVLRGGGSLFEAKARRMKERNGASTHRETCVYVFLCVHQRTHIVVGTLVGKRGMGAGTESEHGGLGGGHCA